MKSEEEVVDCHICRIVGFDDVVEVSDRMRCLAFWMLE